MGIGPTSEAWEASILPLYDARLETTSSSTRLAQGRPAIRCDLQTGLHGTRRTWSGVRESNPRPDLGKVPCYHYTNAALPTIVLQKRCAVEDLDFRPLPCERSALPTELTARIRWEQSLGRFFVSPYGDEVSVRTPQRNLVAHGGFDPPLLA